jgi:hypothetical protein
VKTFCRFEVWFGLLTGLVCSSCGGRSVLDDVRPYGDGNTAGIEGREIVPLGSGILTDDIGATTVGPTTPSQPAVGPTAVPTTPSLPTTVPTGVTPTGNPTDTTSPPTTGVTTTAVPTTSSATTMPTTSTATWTDSGTTGPTEPVLPALVPFPPEGYPPNIPPGFEGVDWQDPWQCYPVEYNRVDYCSLGFSCENTAYGSTSCYLQGDTWYCDCNANTDVASMQFSQNSILEGEACRIAGSLCVSEWSEGQTGECYESNYPGQDFCSYAMYCSYELSSGKEIFASKSVQRSNTCSHSSVGGKDYVSCACSNNTLGEFSVAWDPYSSCLVANQVCSWGVDDGSLGETECAWNSSSSDLVSCYNFERCVQSATAGGTPFGLVTGRETYCYRQAEDDWSCDCNNDGADVRTIVADDAQDACQMAVADCP